MSRPYSKPSMAELEQIFARNRADPGALNDLAIELQQHRKSDHAKRLLGQVLNALKDAGPEPQASTPRASGQSGRPADQVDGERELESRTHKQSRPFPPIRDRAENIL